MARDRFDGDSRSPRRGADASPAGAGQWGRPEGVRKPHAEPGTAAARPRPPVPRPPVPRSPVPRSPVVGSPGSGLPVRWRGADPLPGPPAGVPFRGHDAATPPAAPAPASASQIGRAHV